MAVMGRFQLSILLVSGPTEVIRLASCPSGADVVLEASSRHVNYILQYGQESNPDGSTPSWRPLITRRQLLVLNLVLLT
ncbi:predicted protein [Arabidopsis lyrata subsp. lyrata]|uniref:Predicted protein n=1 Tax=Arabidopsis lyrata subsp. lyrata TaxID=81972 RepID=D7KHI0_ARALL|nr:predicted protein [Arabidopsis lyrata subsp. lyrata]